MLSFHEDNDRITSCRAREILRGFGYADDIADNPAYQDIVRSQWPKTRPILTSRWDKYRLKRGQRIGNAGGRYLSDFITDGPLSDSTIGDFLL